jgi:hypothetical protein
MQTKINCSDYFVPTDGIRLPFFLGSGDFGTSPFSGQHLVKLISSTKTEHTTLIAHRLTNSHQPPRYIGTVQGRDGRTRCRAVMGEEVSPAFCFNVSVRFWPTRTEGPAQAIGGSLRISGPAG